MSQTMAERIGPYRLRRIEHHEITDADATGGGALVYEAEDRAGRTVALHLLPVAQDVSGGGPSQTRAARLEAAARAVAALTHPPRTHAHLLRVYGVALFAETPHGPAHYLATEFVQSQTLRDRVRQGGPLPLAEAADYLMQVASALDAVHAAGVVHGAVNARNIRFDHRDPHIVKLGGFEQASPADATRGDGSAADRRALRGLLIELLTGRAPAAPSAGAAPTLPGASATVAALNAALVKDFATAMEFALAVRAAAPPEAARPARAAGPISAAEVRPTRAGKVLIGIGLAAIAVAGTGLSRNGSQTTDVPQTMLPASASVRLPAPADTAAPARPAPAPARMQMPRKVTGPVSRTATGGGRTAAGRRDGQAGERQPVRR